MFYITELLQEYSCLIYSSYLLAPITTNNANQVNRYNQVYKVMWHKASTLRLAYLVFELTFLIYTMVKSLFFAFSTNVQAQWFIQTYPLIIDIWLVDRQNQLVAFKCSVLILMRVYSLMRPSIEYKNHQPHVTDTSNNYSRVNANKRQSIINSINVRLSSNEFSKYQSIISNGNELSIATQNISAPIGERFLISMIDKRNLMVSYSRTLCNLFIDSDNFMGLFSEGFVSPKNCINYNDLDLIRDNEIICERNYMVNIYCNELNKLEARLNKHLNIFIDLDHLESHPQLDRQALRNLFFTSTIIWMITVILGMTFIAHIIVRSYRINQVVAWCWAHQAVFLFELTYSTALFAATIFDTIYQNCVIILLKARVFHTRQLMENTLVHLRRIHRLQIILLDTSYLGDLLKRPKDNKTSGDPNDDYDSSDDNESYHRQKILTIPKKQIFLEQLISRQQQAKLEIACCSYRKNQASLLIEFHLKMVVKIRQETKRVTKFSEVYLNIALIQKTLSIIWLLAIYIKNTNENGIEGILSHNIIKTVLFIYALEICCYLFNASFLSWEFHQLEKLLYRMLQFSDVFINEQQTANLKRCCDDLTHHDLSQVILGSLKVNFARVSMY